MSIKRLLRFSDQDGLTEVSNGNNIRRDQLTSDDVFVLGKDIACHVAAADLWLCHRRWLRSYLLDWQEGFPSRAQWGSWCLHSLPEDLQPPAGYAHPEDDGGGRK